MTRITNLRPGCVGIDLQPPLKPMRRDEDRYPLWLRDDPDLTLYSRKRRKADRAFCILLAVCVFGYLAVESARFLLTPEGHGLM